MALGAGCPWGTVFQAPGFLDPWFQAYAHTHEPVLVAGTARGGELVGFLPMAREIATAALTPAGAHQAEYQGWLATPGSSNRFITRALAALQVHGRPIRFSWLPSGTPLPSRRAWRQVDIWPVTVTAPRGLLDCTSAHPGAWRRNRSTRSKINRLARLGPLRLRRLQTVTELAAVLPRIADCVDFRHAAMHGNQPFADDPHKAPFHLELLAGGVLHATVLEAGTEVLAAHLGAISGSGVLLGVLAHAPEHAAQSPGKILLHMLGDLLASEGRALFDLTPGDDYKLRFATRTDQVTRLDCHTAPLSAARVTGRLLIGRLGRGIANAIGSDPARIRDAVTRLRGSLVGRGATRPDQPRHWRFPASREHPQIAPAGQARVGRNDLRDLLGYRPGSPTDPTRRAFLLAAQERLAAGHTVHTIATEGRLLAWAWEPAGSDRLPVTRELEVGATEHGYSILPGLIVALVAAGCRDLTLPEEVVIVSQDPRVEAALLDLGWRRATQPPPA